MAVWDAPAAAFLARPADEGVPGAYVEEAERSKGRRRLPGHATLFCRQTNKTYFLATMRLPAAFSESSVLDPPRIEVFRSTSSMTSAADTVRA